MTREGFSAYICEAPPHAALVRFWNEANGRVWTGRASELHPCFNVAYLWWKLTGIERFRVLSAEKGRAA